MKTIDKLEIILQKWKNKIIDLNGYTANISN